MWRATSMCQINITFCKKTFRDQKIFNLYLDKLIFYVNVFLIRNVMLIQKTKYFIFYYKGITSVCVYN